ncbi:translation initiation factor IF-2 subunit beta [Candidatus Pacearchaeota archaeon CG1_02_32_132]|nr:MAG: translation initiation factor IF-2 subunit beta [Candidatus Pacearchaeota archaeon CG1_02_32_132]
MDYEKLLDKAYNEVKTITGSSERFEIPRVKGEVAGKNTIITNIQEIASYIRRPIEQLAKFLLKELAVSGKIDNSRLILNRKLNSNLVNEKIQLYVKEFVLCHECKKPDTEVISEKGIKFKHCLACGAKYPIKSKI